MKIHMCAIAGIIDFQKHNPQNAVYRQMLNQMTNRGPDDEGMYFSYSAVLLHKRLKVIDPQNSLQPMTKSFHGSTYTIVYNGEIYNTDEIRSKLLSLGHTFTTKGDTEVILTAYIQYGKKCLDMFNGIFAFAVWNETTQTIFFARDPMGVKPFFYFTSDNLFIFASTIPALLCHPRIPHTIDAVSVAEIMLLGPGRTPHNAIFTHISELPRGFCGTFSSHGLSIEKYFFLTDTPHADSFDQTVSKTKHLVTDSITRQLVSDVPIGTFLSGGLDSSIISAVAAEHMRSCGKTLDTFSVTYKDNTKYFTASHFQPDSDEKYIETMVKHINSNHHEVVLDTPAVIDALLPVVDEKGLPGMADVDSSLLAFCKQIKKYVTVALSGECADEAA